MKDAQYVYLPDSHKQVRDPQIKGENSSKYVDYEIYLKVCVIA